MSILLTENCSVKSKMEFKIKSWKKLPYNFSLKTHQDTEDRATKDHSFKKAPEQASPSFSGSI